MRIAVCQPYRNSAPAQNLDTALRMLKAAKEAYCADLVCFPEAFPFSYKSKMGINGDGVKCIRDACVKHGLNAIYGQIIFNEKEGVSNSAVIVGKNGDIMWRYD